MFSGSVSTVTAERTDADAGQIDGRAEDGDRHGGHEHDGDDGFRVVRARGGNALVQIHDVSLVGS